MGILKEYFFNSSLHGLHFIVDSRLHWTERLFWTVAVIASWGASLALMFNAIDQYQSQKIAISVDTSYLHWEIDFPAIVICENRNDKKMEEANDKVFGNILEQLPKMERFVFYDGTMTFKEVCQIRGKLRDRCLLGNYSYYMHKFRTSCAEAIGSCYYNDEEFPCCDEFLPIGSFHGPCFAFNSLVSRKYTGRSQLPFKIVHRSNHPYGNLSIELSHIGFIIYGLSQDAVPTKRSSNEYALMESATSTGILGGTHYKTFLSVQESFTDEDSRLLSVENRGCRFYDENNLRHSKVYSLSACENECLIEAQLSKCNCVVHTLPHNGEVTECDFDGLICTINRHNDIANKSETCGCTSSCFDTEVGNVGFTKGPLKNSMLEKPKDGFKIDFIVQPPTIRYSRTVVKTPLSMIVSVGGTVSLFIGASLLTIIEIIYYFIIRPLGTKYMEAMKNKEKKCIKSGVEEDGYYFEYVN